ncbi:MAG: hypothetical protein ACI9OU_001412 [Candidatus Promineifilaceae bacterium]|jgi:hypothetical protein
MKTDIRHFLTVAVLLWGIAMPAHSTVVINELVAINETGLTDADGDPSDWMELYNASSSAVNLSGWHLTDDSSDLTRWTFPSTNLAPFGFIVVFASGKDHRTAGQELHTDFKLSGSGEYLALIRPDGTTVEHAYTPGFPAQKTDASYGIPADSAATLTLVSTGATCTAWVPTDDSAASNWLDLAFNDSGWAAGQTGVGYENAPGNSINYTDLISTDLLDAMYNSNRTAYIRIPFDLTEVALPHQLVLNVQFDDGFAAYINGNLVAATNAPPSPDWSDGSTAPHDDDEAILFNPFALPGAAALLLPATNLLAIHGLNRDVDSSDFLVRPELLGVPLSTNISASPQHFSTPTPGAPNSAEILGLVGDPLFSVERGYYNVPFPLSITTLTAQAAIYVTGDSSDPSPTNGTLYTQAMVISNTTILRAAAFRASYQSSDISTHTYIFLDDVIHQTGVGRPGPPDPATSDWSYEMDPDIVQDLRFSQHMTNALLSLPALCLALPDDALWGTNGIYANPDQFGFDWERACAIELISADGKDDFQVNAGLRIQGAGSRFRNIGKKSMRLAFRERYGDTRLEEPFFPDADVASFDAITLRGNYFDSWTVHAAGNGETIGRLAALQFRDAFARHTHADMGRHAIQDRWVHLYLNGVYWGIYNATERPDQEFAADYFGGTPEDYDILKQRPLGTANGSPPEIVNGDLSAWNELITLVKSDTTDPAVYAQIEDVLQIDAFIDYIILNIWGGNADWPHNNWYGIRNKTIGAKWYFTEWDGENFIFNLSESSKLTTNIDNSPGILYDRLRLNTEFQLRFADHLQRHSANGGALTPEAGIARLRAITNNIALSMIAESARWGDERVNPPYTPPDHWDVTLANKITTYLPQRTAIVLTQFNSIDLYPDLEAPTLHPHGGQMTAGSLVSITGSNIFYTLDGSDPREGGSGNAVGFSYTAPIPFAHTMRIKARARDAGGNWSPLTEGVFTHDQHTPLIVTEIMYHPRPPTPGSSETNYVSSDFEFIEIQNTATQTIGLAGLTIDRGLLFDFDRATSLTLAPGAVAVIVRNADAFAFRYPAVSASAVLGIFQGTYDRFPIQRLANDGETVRCVDALGRNIQDITYDDIWYSATDGLGYSLTRVIPTADSEDLSKPTAWQTSSLLDGTPGVMDSAQRPQPGSIVINEILTHQDQDEPGDWIELHNTTTGAVDISHWWLGDNAHLPLRFQIPPASIVPAGGFVRFTEATHFGTNGLAGTNGFALSELGETLFLSVASNGHVVVYIDQEQFDAAASTVTFGRHIKSTGRKDFVAQSQATPNAANAYPKIGPIVTSEVMYHPADTNSCEFVELYNPGPSAVHLYDPANTQNLWQLDGAVSYTFPSGTIMLPDTYALVSATNETALRAVYTNIPPSTVFLGPWTGRLDNAGETLRLLRPTNPEPDGTVPYVLVERISYSEDAPWPATANGSGPALERRLTSLYANDGINWIAGFPRGSPGRAQPRVVVGSLAVTFEDAVVDVVPDIVWSNGTVTQIELLVGTNVVATEPLSWNGASPGNTYTLSLRITDGDGTHLSPPVSFVWPRVDAGPDRVIKLGEALALTGDITVGEAAYAADITAWDTLRGPTAVSFSAREALSTFASFALPGDYTLALSATINSIAFTDQLHVSVVASNSPNRIPYHEPFEVYAVGAEMPGLAGWAGNAANAAVVMTTQYTWSNHYPIAGAHSAVLDLRDTVTNTFADTHVFTNIWIDTMLECMFWREETPPETRLTDQFAIYVNTNAHPVVWHGAPLGTSGSNRWTVLPEVSLTEQTWFRLTLKNDYAQTPPRCALWINAMPVTNTHAMFALAYTNNLQLNGIRNAGTFKMDDLVVEDYDILHYRKLTATHGPNGALNPTGNILVPYGANTNVNVQPAPYYHTAALLLDGLSLPLTDNVTFTQVVSRHALHADFAATLATNATPQWWLAHHYAITNNFDASALSDSDGDGRAAWQEWIGGTLPTNGLSVPLLTIQLGTNGVALTYMASEDRTYDIDYCLSLDPATPWQLLQGNRPGPGSTQTLFDATADTNRLYRLRVRLP